MRVWLEKGKQKELLERERKRFNLSWIELANKLGLKFGTLNNLHYETALIEESIFDKLQLSSEYRKFIVHKLPENWGKIKGGKLSPGNTKEIKIPRQSEELAELWGILLGDGNINRTKGYKIGTYNINISGHCILDKDYLLDFVKPLGEKLFGIKGRFIYSKHKQGLRVIFDSKNIVDYFEKEGFKPGDKIRNQSTIPQWIAKNRKFLAACLRGLHDTDGTFYKLTNQNSYQIGFTNHDITLLRGAQKGLLSLGIGVSKIMNNRKYVITKKSEIAKFYKVVGFHNSKHFNKVINANLAPW